jgi:hypothetical protein
MREMVWLLMAFGFIFGFMGSVGLFVIPKECVWQQRERQDTILLAIACFIAAGVGKYIGW